MNADSIRTLHTYNYAQHRRLWESILMLSEAQFTQEFDYSIGSIRNHMVHVMSVDERWLARVQDAPAPDRLDPAPFDSRRAVFEYWVGVERRVLDCVAGLDDAQLLRDVTYPVSRFPEPVTNTVWEILVHMVNHGTDHRTQVLALLHRLGAPTFEHDLIIHLWEQDA